MAATVQIHEMTADEAGVNKTSSTVRFKSADATTVDTNNRIQIPTSGTTYSYSKHLRVYVDSAPSVDISNIQAYSDGSNGFGTGVYLQYTTHTAFSSNVNTNISGTDFFTATSGAAVNMDQYNDTAGFTGTGYAGDHLRLQLYVISTASAGTVPAETLTVSYDES